MKGKGWAYGFLSVSWLEPRITREDYPFLYRELKDEWPGKIKDIIHQAKALEEECIPSLPPDEFVIISDAIAVIITTLAQCLENNKQALSTKEAE